MAHYLRINERENIDWMKKFISSLMSRDPNDRFLQVNYSYLLAWQEAIESVVSTKSDSIPDRLILEKDKAELTPPPPKKRGRPASTDKKKKRTTKPAVVVNDIFMCQVHTNRTGKQAPRDNCETCWSIYKKLHGPAEYDLARRKFNAKQNKGNYASG